MRLTTWNVNGIRNPFSYPPWNLARTFPAMFDILDADIVVMQELKIQRKDLRDDMVLLDGWDCYFSLPKQKKGYSGVGIYTRNATCAPIHAEEGLLGVLTPPSSTTEYRHLPDAEHIGGYPTITQIADIAENVQLSIDATLLDSEGRCVCLEFPAFVLFGVYSPANSNGQRDGFRLAFLSVLDCRIRNLIKMGKRVVLVGDLNVSRAELDTASAAEDIRKAGLTHEDYISTPNRRIFNQLIIGGEVVGSRDAGREDALLLDVIREFHPNRAGMYTHWEQKINARPGNFGSRIDFILASGAMQGWFSEANIQEGLMGSDHCPVYTVLKAMVSAGAYQEVQHLLDIMNPPGVFVQGIRQRPWNIKDVPNFSARLMPEFYQRRSIKDMFKNPAGPPHSSGSSPFLSQSAVTQVATHLAANGAAQSSPTVLPEIAYPAESSSLESSDKKRKTIEPPATKAKKQKAAASAPAKPTPNKGQQSLKGFFQPKTTSQAGTSAGKRSSASVNVTPERCFSDSHTSMRVNASSFDGSGLRVTPTSPLTLTDSDHVIPAQRDIIATSTAIARSQTPIKPDPPPPPTPQNFLTTSPSDIDDDVHDPIVSKESWESLFRKPAAALCEEHDEPCKRMLTKKKGENQGRSFWMCARPLGPSGAKERGTQWRCPTFIWCSDRKGE